METKEQKIKNKVLDLFYINGNISVYINDFINNSIVEKKFLIESIEICRQDYNIILSKIVEELEKELKELEDGKRN